MVNRIRTINRPKLYCIAAVRGMVAAVAISLVVPWPALPHDLHILGSKLRGAVDDETTIYVTWSHAQPIDDVVDPDDLEHFQWMDPTGSRHPLFKEKNAGTHAQKVKLEEEGVYQAAAAAKTTIVTKIAGHDGVHRHLRGTKEDAKKAAPTSKILSARKNQQYAKTMVVVGRPMKAAPPIGLPFEIVPLDKPADWKVETPLKFEVRIDDAKLTTGELKANRLSLDNDADALHESWAIRKPISKKGVALLVFDTPGRWLLQVEREVETKANKRNLYDRESYVTTLIIEIVR